MPGYLSSQSREALERVRGGDGSRKQQPGLERLRDIRALIRALEEDAASLQAVRDALAGGADWEQIAEAAGLKSAAAKWRWQGSDEEIAQRHEAGRKRSARPSSVPTELPGLSVSELATQRGVSAQAIYLQIRRGTLRSEKVTLPDGRSYTRVFPEGEQGDAAEPGAE